MSLGKRCAAEFIGTLWLVFGGCGSAVLAARLLVPADNTTINLGIGLLGVALAFGLTVLTMAYAIGHISGCHLNPAVTIGLCVARRIPTSEVLPYIIAQVLGAVAGAGILFVIASGQADFSTAGGFASNLPYLFRSERRIARPEHSRARGVLPSARLLQSLRRGGVRDAAERGPRSRAARSR